MTKRKGFIRVSRDAFIKLLSFRDKSIFINRSGIILKNNLTIKYERKRSFDKVEGNVKCRERT